MTLETDIVSRAQRNGLTLAEQRELELAEPWTASWAGLFRAGADRLAAWLAAGRPVVDRTHLTVEGTPSIVRAARAVVARLPEAIANFLVGNVEIVCVGADWAGWCGDAPLPPCDAPIRIALATTDPGYIAHELMHAWHRSPLPAVCRLTAEQRDRVDVALRSIALEEGRVDKFVESSMLSERAADELATVLGFSVDTTSGAHGDRRRAGMRRDVEEAAGFCCDDGESLCDTPGHELSE